MCSFLECVKYIYGVRDICPCSVANDVDPKRGSRNVRAITRVVEHFDVYNYYCRPRTKINF